MIRGEKGTIYRAPTVVLAFLCLLLFAAPVARAQETPDAQVMEGVSLHLRAAPTTASSTLTVLAPLTPLTILDQSGDEAWLQVQTPDGTVGWVYHSYVTVYVNIVTTFPAESAYLRLPPEVVDHVQQVYAEGQAQGKRADIFAKVGDSITVSHMALNPIGDGVYNLGDYPYLQDVIDYYSTAQTRDGHNSFNEDSLAAKVGWTSSRVLDPEAGNPASCLPDEAPLLCEYRLLQPSVALIMFGTNDVSALTADQYRANLSRIVEISEAEGIIPILSTIPVREGFEAGVRQFNQVIAEVAQAHAIPLLDYGAAMQPLGAGGLGADGAHPSVPPKGYEAAADFRSQNLRYGYVIRNLTALQMLDAVWRCVQ